MTHHGDKHVDEDDDDDDVVDAEQVGANRLHQGGAALRLSSLIYVH
jgi:hypothetical protein